MSPGKPARDSASPSTSRHVFELTVLNEVGAICASAGSPQELLTRTTRLVADSLFPDNCGFLLLDGDRRVLVPHESFVLTNPDVISTEIPLSTGLTGKTARTGRPWRVGEVRLDPDYLNSDSRTHSELCVPLRVRGEVYGVMNIESSQPAAFTEADERLIIAVLDIVGAALERLHHQEQLRSSEARFRRMLDSLPLGVFVHDGQQMYYANPAAMQILGVDSVERLYQMSPLEIVAPPYRDLAQQRIQTVLQTRGALPKVEAQICRLDGSIADVEVTSLWTEYADRDCVQVHFNDITDRKQAERNLRLTEQRFSLFMQHLPGLAWIKDAEGRYVYANAAAVNVFRTTSDQLIGKTDRDLFPPETAAQFQSADQRALSEGREVQTVETLEHADGILHHSLVSKFPLPGPDGRHSLVGGIALDVTEQKRSEELLRANEARFRLLFDGAANAIFWADADTGLLTHCNRAAETLLGRDRREIIGQPQSFLHPPEEADRYRQLFQDHASSASTAPVEVEVIRTDGRRIDVAISPSVTVIGGQRVIQGIFRDISERKQAEQTILKLSTFRETIIRTAAEGICVCVPVAEFPFVAFSVWNDRMTEITGYSLEEINRLGWYQSLYPDPGVRQRAQERMDRMRHGDDLHGEEWEITRKDGERRTVSISTSRLELDGNLPAVAALIQDVTLQKQAVQSLKESARELQLFRALMNLTNDTIHVIDPVTSRFLDVNDRACERLGYSRGELLQLRVIDIEAILPDQFSWQQHVRDVKAAGSMLLEGIHRRQDGSTFPVEINVRHVRVDRQEYMVAVVRDITERRQADAVRQTIMEDLLRSEERFSKLFYASPFSIIVASYPVGKIIEANDAFLRLFEYPREEVIGRTTGELDIWVLASDRQRMLDSLQAHGASRNKEYLFRTKSGGQRTLVMSVEIIRLHGEDYSLAMSIDISDRKAAEAELHKTHELLQAIIQSTTDAVFVKDRQGNYLLFNEAAGHFVGRPSAEVIGKDDTALFDDAAVKLIQSHDRLVMESGIVSTTEETLTAAGVSRTFLATRAPYRDVAGNVTGVIGISRDISERKRSENMIRQSLSLMKATLDATADGILVVDLEGRIVDLNQQFLAVWKFPAHLIAAGRKEDLISTFNQHQVMVEMLGQLQHPEAFVERVREIYQSPRESSFDVIEFRDGRVLERQSRPQLLEGHPVGRVWSFRDVSAQRQLEQQLRQSQKMEAVGQLAGGIAHDFNNLLTVINGYCDLLLGKKSRRNSWADSVAEIRDAGRRAAQLTEQLLSFSRKSLISLQVVPLNDVVIHAERLLRRLVGPQIDLRLELDPQTGCIRADVTQLEQVLMNLAVNAKDAMPEGGRLTISTSATPQLGWLREDGSARQGDRTVVLMVGDTGVGMTVEQRARIFEPFFTTKDVGKGSGLGLAVVHGIVQQHGGEIQVDSQPGQGTRFTVLFPAVDEMATFSPAQNLETNQAGTETVLLVEDEVGVRRMARQAIEAQGYHVLEASNGHEALDIARLCAEPIDLLITDVVMPGLSGRQVADALFESHPQLRVMFLSGYHEEQSVRDIARRPKEIFLKKPFTPQELTRLIRQHLDANRT